MINNFILTLGVNSIGSSFSDHVMNQCLNYKTLYFSFISNAALNSFL